MDGGMFTLSGLKPEVKSHRVRDPQIHLFGPLQYISKVGPSWKFFLIFIMLGRGSMLIVRQVSRSPSKYLEVNTLDLGEISSASNFDDEAPLVWDLRAVTQVGLALEVPLLGTAFPSISHNVGSFTHNAYFLCSSSYTPKLSQFSIPDWNGLDIL